MKIKGILALACSLVAFTTGSHAQSAIQAAPGDMAGDSEHSALDIVVTAQKRAQSLQEVPFAVTAFGPDQVEAQRLFGLEDLAKNTPNFTIASNSPSQPVLTIRGIGSTNREAGSDRSVVPFVDEIYLGRTSASTFDIFDIERVEVLRGPQGTLFGRNVSGGAISITTAKPVDRIEAKAQLTAGNYDRFEARAMINVPLTESWAARVTGSTVRHGGFYDNVLLGDDNVGRLRSNDIRGQLLYNDHDGTRVLFAAAGYESKTHGLPSKNVRGQATQANFEAAIAQYTTSAFPSALPVSDPWSVENNIIGDSRSSGGRVYGRLEKEFGGVSLTFIPAYVWSSLNESRDLGGFPIRDAGALTAGFESTRYENEKYNALSLEARLGSTGGGTFDWVAGVYYLAEETDRSQELVRQINNSYSNPIFLQASNDESIAGFGQVSWRMTDSIELTVGARYTHDSRRFSLETADLITSAERASIIAQLGRAPTIAPLQELFRGNVQRSENAFTPKVAIRFEPIRHQNLYLSWSRGYKGGGFDASATRLVNLGVGFEPETVDSYEAGLKSLLFDRTLRLNIAGFYTDFKNLQLRDRTLLIPGNEASAIVQVINAARAKIKGLEIETVWQVSDSFNVGGSLSILDSKVTRANPGSTVLLGTALPRAPKTTYSLNANYHLDRGRSGLPFDLELAADYRHSSSIYFDINEQLASTQPAFDLVNARLTLAVSEQVQIMLWGKNLGNKLYFSEAQASAAGRSAAVTWGDPRTFGVTLTLRK